MLVCRFLTVVNVVAYVLKDPRTSEGGSSYHYCVHSVPVETFFGALGGGYVSVADDRYAHMRVVLYSTYHFPVCIPAVHLRPCPSVDGEFADAAVLQCFCEVKYKGLLRGCLSPPVV